MYTQSLHFAYMENSSDIGSDNLYLAYFHAGSVGSGQTFVGAVGE